MRLQIELHDVISHLLKHAVRTSLFFVLLAVGMSMSLSGCASKKDVTLDEFNRVAEGMSYEQVVEIIGKEGAETGRSEAGPAATDAERQLIANTKMYMWSNEDKSNMVCTFMEDKLVTKDQSGLE